MTHKMQIKKPNIKDYFADGLGSVNKDALSFISSNPKVATLIKKTERLRAALILVDLSANKSQSKLSLFADEILFSLFDIAQSKKQDSASTFKAGVFKIMETLDSLFISGRISEENARLLKEASLALLKNFSQYEIEITTPNILLFAEDLLPSLSANTETHKGHIKDIENVKDNKDTANKGHIKDKYENPNISALKTTVKEKGDTVSGKSNKQYRNLDQVALLQSKRMQIIELLSSESKLTASEITKKLENKWSQKTIQRELLAMLKEGILVKEGEKRWTRYSINY